MKTLQELFDEAEIKHFKAKEFLYLGGANETVKLNTVPPRSMYVTIVQLAKVCDQIREIYGKPIFITSCYRNEVYNRHVGGARNSQHKLGKAADMVGTDVERLHKVALELRDEGVFEGGVGKYDTFVHVDIRGQNVTW